MEVSMEDTNLNINDIVESVTETIPKKPKNREFKEKVCKVLLYNKQTKTLDVLFDSYGIRLKNVKDFTGNTVSIKFYGEIGQPNFKYKL